MLFAVEGAGGKRPTAHRPPNSCSGCSYSVNMAVVQAHHYQTVTPINAPTAVQHKDMGRTRSACVQGCSSAAIAHQQPVWVVGKHNRHVLYPQLECSIGCVLSFVLTTSPRPLCLPLPH